MLNHDVIVNMPVPMRFLVSDSIFQMIVMKGKVASKTVPRRLRAWCAVI